MGSKLLANMGPEGGESRAGTEEGEGADASTMAGGMGRGIKCQQRELSWQLAARGQAVRDLLQREGKEASCRCAKGIVNEKLQAFVCSDLFVLCWQPKCIQESSLLHAEASSLPVPKHRYHEVGLTS